MGWRAACENDSRIVELNGVDAAAEFDGIARECMDMSGPEFLRRYDRGEFADVTEDDNPGIVDMMLALPLVR